MEKHPNQEFGPEEIDAKIEKLLEKLESYAELYNRLSEELKDEWYYIEMEAKVSKNKQQAEVRLDEFLKVLESEAKKLE